ncbi:centrosomal protein of 97 kDa isoform X2 [Centruroides vittatus]|uniref:centrosomal protein of 97 kDa isoform X2 n=1 Tax=Centruroides vittatus TaxID=120091 RepID=UPI00350F149F
MTVSEKVLDLSDKNLKKLEKRDGVGFHGLILDNNELCKLENLDRFPDLEKLSACGNRLSRMYGVAKLHHLVNLDLSNNNIAWIEGLKELTQLSVLNLSRNNIKCVQSLQHCINLTHIDLSKNIISALTDLSYLTKLQTLNVDGNKITTLQNASTFFPHSLCSLSLADNCITDLNEISYLYGLPCLEQLAIANNPAILMTGQLAGFDYRPFVVNWCLGIRLLDGFVVTQKESLKAEWLYSQGKGRHFQPGEHIELVEYLSQVCPLTTADQLIVEEEERLTRILRMQRQHREELLHEMSNSPKEQRKWTQQSPLREQLQSSDDKSHMSPKLSSQDRESRVNVHNSSENGFLPDKLQKNEQAVTSNELSQLENNKINSNKQERTIFSTAKSPVTIEQIPTTEMLKSCFQSYEDRIIRPSHNIEMIKSVNSISGSYLSNVVSNTTPVRKISIKRSSTHSPSSPATGRRPRTPRAQWKSRVSSSRGSSPQDTECRRALHARHNSESDTSEECGWPYKATGIQSPLRQRKQSTEKTTRHSNCTSLRHSYSQTPIHSDPSRSKTPSSVNNNVCNENRRNVNRILQSGSLIPSPCNSPIIGSRASRSPIKKSISDNVICVTQQQEKLNAQKLKKMEKAVIKIQSTWRGYYARHFNPAVYGARQEIRLRRMEDSIQFLHNIVLRQQEELQQEKELRKVQAADISKLHVQLEQIQESLEKISEIKHQNLIVREGELETNLMCVIDTNKGNEDKKNIPCVLDEKEMLSNPNGPTITQQSEKAKNSLVPFTPISPSHTSPVGSPGDVKISKSSNAVHCADICVPVASESDTDSGWQSMIGSFAGDGQSLENGFHILENGKNDSVGTTMSSGIPTLCISQKVVNNSSGSKLAHGITNEENLINSIRDSFLTSSSIFQEEVTNCILLSNKNKLGCSSNNNNNEDSGNQKDGNLNKNSISVHETVNQLKVPKLENLASDLSLKAVASDSLCSTPESSCTVIVQASKDEAVCVTSHSDSKNDNTIQKVLSPERKTSKDILNMEKSTISSKNNEILNLVHDAEVNVELLNSPSRLSKYRNNDTITDDEKTAELPRLKEYNSCMKNASAPVESSLNTNESEKITIGSQEKAVPSRELSQQKFRELEGTIGQILTSPEGADISSEVE